VVLLFVGVGQDRAVVRVTTVTLCQAASYSHFLLLVELEAVVVIEARACGLHRVWVHGRREGAAIEMDEPAICIGSVVALERVLGIGHELFVFVHDKVVMIVQPEPSGGSVRTALDRSLGADFLRGIWRSFAHGF
jgi:hypothetical protein